MEEEIDGPWGEMTRAERKIMPWVVGGLLLAAIGIFIMIMWVLSK